jgi:hypothetical protein
MAVRSDILTAFSFVGDRSMCLTDLMSLLRERGIAATECQIRWAMKAGKVSRPPLDGSLRFNFGPQQVREILALFEPNVAFVHGGNAVPSRQKEV